MFLSRGFCEDWSGNVGIFADRCLTELLKSSNRGEVKPEEGDERHAHAYRPGVVFLEPQHPHDFNSVHKKTAARARL